LRCTKGYLFLCFSRSAKKPKNRYEANLDQYIRMMHLTEVEAAGWVRVPAGAYSFVKDNARTKYEAYTPDWSSWKPDKSPLSTGIAQFRECSFDLETNSHDDALLSCATRLDNQIIQIATTFSDFGDPNGPFKILFVLGVCNDIADPTGRTRVFRFQTEVEMLLAWRHLIVNWDPDTVHAYNGWDFDFGYLAERAKLLGCWEEFRHLGRLMDRPSELVEKTMSSKAYGDNHWKQLPMSGRFVFDSMAYIKRELAPTFHSLGYVSEMFLSRKLPDFPFAIVQGSREVTVTFPGHGFSENTVIHFSNIETPNLTQLPDGKSAYLLAGWSYEDLHGDNDPESDRKGLFTITRVISSNEFTFDMPFAANQTLPKAGGTEAAVFETKHDVKFPVMFKAFREQDVDILTRVGKYCIQDTLLPQKIFDKLSVLPNLIEMAKATWVPVEYLITRGQQVKVFSQICKEANATGWAVPTVQRQEKGDGAAGYSGGLVLEPFIGFFDEPVAVPDFKSLYPSTMYDGNYCYTTLVKHERYLNIPGAKYNKVWVSEDRFHTFAMNYVGIVPCILKCLLDSREIRKGAMKTAKTAIERTIHNGAQLALKVSANSIYGFTGVDPATSLLPCMAIAETTTGQGRRSTLTSVDFVEDLSNLREIVMCDLYLPLDYPYLMRNDAKRECFHVTGAGLLKMHTLGLSIWTTAKWTTITEISLNPEGDKIRVHVAAGEILTMRNLRERVLAQRAPVKSVNVPKEKRTADTAIAMCRANGVAVVYGDTDSIFLLYDSSHLAHLGRSMRVAYCGIVAAYMASRITHYLRSLNPFTPPDRQIMEFQYEKTYRFFIMFMKKRYAGEMTEHNPERFSQDKKGVALKRKDFCNFVKEPYSKILKVIWDPSDTVTRNDRVSSALSVVRQAVEDLINNRVPFDKLIISKSLKDSYKMRDKKELKSTKKARHNDFGPDNIFVGSHVEWIGGKGIVMEKPDGQSFVRVNRKSGNEDAPAIGLDLQYSSITARSASVMTLTKIIDPATTEQELEPIKSAHVRLTRRMFARDPATAPKSGARVPFVFCEGPASMLQHQRAENPAYAQLNNLHIDPIYYLERQCANAWGQILDTVCPGLVSQIFAEAYNRYENRRKNQPDLVAVLQGHHAVANREIRIVNKINVTIPVVVSKKRKRVDKRVAPPGQPSVATFFKK
jgi:DNA polymerase elongation subunit (family B)